MVDLRKDKRAPASLKVKYKSATIDQFMEQFGTDVSRGGIFIKTKKPIEIGALLKLELQLSDASPVIHGIGQVCWRREPGPDPGLPAGMGIKFIKLHPDSRAIVDRIIHSRGGRPSRFDQTEGAELAPPSTPPSASDLDSRPTRRPPPPSPRPPAAPPSAKNRPSSPGAAAVAGLFADTAIARGAPPPPSPFAGRSSFFPDAGPDNGAQSPITAPPRIKPPPSAPSPPRPPTPKPPAGVAARAEQARHSGEFLTTALAEGGIASEPAKRAAASADAPKSGDDRLIDRLFADVMQPSAPSDEEPPARNSGSVDDVFAALGEEEGLSARARAATPTAATAPMAPGRRTQPGRSSQPDFGEQADPPVRGSEQEAVDDLFAELDHGARHSPVPAADARVSRPELAAAAAAPWGGEAGSGSDEDGDLPIDVSVPPAPPVPGLRSSAPSSIPALRPGERRPPLLVGILLVLVVIGGVGVYFYVQRGASSSAKPAESPGVVPEPSVPAAPSAAAAEPSAAGAAALKPGAVAVEHVAPAGGIEIEVTSVPRGAEVLVDGKAAGVTPLRVALPKGRESKITVSSTGFTPMIKSIAPSAGAEPLRFKLEPLPYELLVRTVPAEAEVSVGSSTAIAPGPLALGHLDGGVQVSVAKPGYQRMTRPVRLDEFVEKEGMMRAEIEVRLSPLPGAAPPTSLTPAPSEQPTRPRPRRPRPSRPPAPPPAPEGSTEPPTVAPAPATPEATAPVVPAPAPSPTPAPIPDPTIDVTEPR